METTENQKERYNFESHETENLITMVKERDILHNFSNPYYHNKDIKEK